MAAIGGTYDGPSSDSDQTSPQDSGPTNISRREVLQILAGGTTAVVLAASSLQGLGEDAPLVEVPQWFNRALAKLNSEKPATQAAKVEVLPEIDSLVNIDLSKLDHASDIYDDQGHRLDRLRVEEIGNELLGVHHSPVGDNKFAVNLVRQLPGTFQYEHIRQIEERASMGDIFQIKDSVIEGFNPILVMFERTLKDEGNRNVVQIYSNAEALKTGKWLEEFEIPKTRGYNEGCPNIINAKVINNPVTGNFIIDIEYDAHFKNEAKQTNLNGSGHLALNLIPDENSYNLSLNKAEFNPNNVLNNIFRANGYIDFGDRVDFELEGRRYQIFELGRKRGNYSFDLVLVDDQNNLKKIQIKTPKGSRSFANPGIRISDDYIELYFYAHTGKNWPDRMRDILAGNGEGGPNIVKIPRNKNRNKEA